MFYCEILLVFNLFKFKKRPNISGIRVVVIILGSKCVFVRMHRPQFDQIFAF